MICRAYRAPQPGSPRLRRVIKRATGFGYAIEFKKADERKIREKPTTKPRGLKADHPRRLSRRCRPRRSHRSHDIHATILHPMCLDHEKMTCRHGGRDWRLTDVHGQVTKELLM